VAIIEELARLRRAEQRREKRRVAAGRAFGRLFVHACTEFFHAWIFMLAVGVIHIEWIHALSTIGYWWSLLLVWMLRGIFSPIQHKDKDSGND
jgi:hypothetical protein